MKILKPLFHGWHSPGQIIAGELFWLGVGTGPRAHGDAYMSMFLAFEAGSLTIWRRAVADRSVTTRVITPQLKASLWLS